MLTRQNALNQVITMRHSHSSCSAMEETGGPASPEEQAVSSHGVDDARHWKERTKQADRQPRDGADGHDVLGGLEAVQREHLHERGVCIDLRVGHHEGQDYAHLGRRARGEGWMSPDIEELRNRQTLRT